MKTLLFGSMILFLTSCHPDNPGPAVHVSETTQQTREDSVDYKQYGACLEELANCRRENRSLQEEVGMLRFQIACHEQRIRR